MTDFNIDTNFAGVENDILDNIYGHFNLTNLNIKTCWTPVPQRVL